MKPIQTLCTALLLVCAQSVFSQQAVPAAGGEGQGLGGTVSYTVGQVFYHYYPGDQYSITEGVQQPYEISVVTGQEMESIHLEMSVYPNPTAEKLILQVASDEAIDLQWQLLTLSGKEIKAGSMTADRTGITMNELADAIYLLHISDANHSLKTFRIVKQTL